MCAFPVDLTKAAFGKLFELPQPVRILFSSSSSSSGLGVSSAAVLYFSTVRSLPGEPQRRQRRHQDQIL